MQNRLIPKNTDGNKFNMAAWVNDHTGPGQEWLFVIPGIGEQERYGILQLANAGVYIDIRNNVDKLNVNALTIQTVDNYAHGEFNDGYNYIKTKLQANPDKIHLVCLSNGGYGMLHWLCTQHPELLKLFATITVIVSGPGIQPASAQALANCGRPVYFISSKNDVTTYNPDGSKKSGSGTSYTVTQQIYDQVKALGGICYLTMYDPGYGHAPTATKVWAATGHKYGGPEMPLGATGTIPAMTWWDWIKANSLSTPIIAPDNTIHVPVPVPAPARKIKGWNVGGNNLIVQMVFKHKTVYYTMPKGDSASNIWIPLKALARPTMTMVHGSPLPIEAKTFDTEDLVGYNIASQDHLLLQIAYDNGETHQYEMPKDNHARNIWIPLAAPEVGTMTMATGNPIRVEANKITD